MLVYYKITILVIERKAWRCDAWAEEQRPSTNTERVHFMDHISEIFWYRLSLSLSLSFFFSFYQCFFAFIQLRPFNFLLTSSRRRICFFVECECDILHETSRRTSFLAREKKSVEPTIRPLSNKAVRKRRQ